MKVNIACLQMASQPYNWDYNIEKATAMIRKAANMGANICLLPEVFIPGYSFSEENFRQAEPLDGTTVSLLKELAKELNVYISGSIIERTDTNFYNTMVFIAPKGLLGTYRKIHVFSLEQKYWKPGKDVTIVDTEFGSIGLGICADMLYPKLWKQYVGKVDLILISSAWPAKPPKINLRYVAHVAKLCQELPVQISRTFQVPVAYSNACHPCVGNLPIGLGTMRCAGYSKIVDKGTVIAAIDSHEEQIIQGSVEISGDRPEVDPSPFKNWIKFSLREKIPKFFVEKVTLPYAKVYYRRHKKKFLD